MAFWRRFLQREALDPLAACAVLDVGTEFAKALVLEIDEGRHGVVRGVGRQRQGLSHMQSGTVADIAAVVDNCQVALQEAEEMAGFRSSQVVIGIAGELVKGFTISHDQERRRPDQPITDQELQRLVDSVQREALHEAERAITWETGLPNVDIRLVHAAVTGATIDGYAVTNRSASRDVMSGSASSTPSHPWCTWEPSRAWRASWTSSCWPSLPSPTPWPAAWAAIRSSRPGHCSST